MKNKWFIGIKKHGEDLLDISNLTILESPPGHYYADPFLAEEGDKTYLFFEDYDYKKGVLAVGELEGLKLKNVHMILDQPWHTSFPSVVKIEDKWYMTPECVLSGELWVYKALRFPDVWIRFGNPVALGRFDDPVLRQTKDGYEIWTSEDGDKVRVFRSTSLVGAWNLIKTKDEAFARSAGHFIGDIRPTQDSVPVYGRAIKFKRDDKVIGGIEPDWMEGLTGCHSFSVSSKYIAIDGRIKLHD